MSSDQTKAIGIHIQANLHAKMKKKCKEQRMTINKYVANLIYRDLFEENEQRPYTGTVVINGS